MCVFSYESIHLSEQLGKENLFHYLPCWFSICLALAHFPFSIQDRFDYWDALIAERVDIIQKSNISTAMCDHDVRMCIARIPANYTSCSPQRFKVMTKTYDKWCNDSKY